MKTARRILIYGIPKTLLLKIILFLVILLIGKNVFAQDFNVTSSITSPIGGGRTGTYTGTEIYNTGSTAYYNVNTRYNGRLSRIILNIPLPSDWPDGDCFSSGDLVYTLTLNMATEDWRNHFATPFISGSSSGTNWATSSVVFVSYKKVYFTFKIPYNDNNCYDYLYLDLKSPSISNTAFTGNTNWNLSNVVLSVNFPTGSTGGSSGGTSSGSSSQEIINNNNENTQDIIENNNQNTQVIRDTLNNGLNSCRNSHNLFNINSDININGFSGNIGSYNTVSDNILTTNGNSSSSQYYGQKFTNLNGKTFTISAKLVSKGTGVGGRIAIFDNGSFKTEKQLGVIGDYQSITYTATSNNIVIAFCTAGGTGAQLTDIQLSEGSSLLSYEPYGEVCTSKIDDVNNSINNDNVDSGTGSDFFNNFHTTDNGGISGIITKPLILINSLLDSNNSCSALTFAIQFPGLQSKSVSFPSGCTLWDNVPSTVVSLYQVFIVGFSSYYLLKRLFKDVEDLKNPEKDEVEVIDL